jgi:hypothetical protein
MKLLNCPLTLDTLTPRQEKQGEGDTEPAVSLTMSSSLKMATLAQFFPNEKTAEAFASAIWNDEGDVRHGLTGALALSYELIGGETLIRLPSNKAEIASFEKADIKALRLTPIAGHCAEIKVRINCHPSESEVGRLYSLLGRELEVTAERTTADADGTDGQQAMRLAVNRDDADTEQPQDGDLPTEPPGADATAFDGIEVE